MLLTVLVSLVVSAAPIDDFFSVEGGASPEICFSKLGGKKACDSRFLLFAMFWISGLRLLDA